MISQAIGTTSAAAVPGYAELELDIESVLRAQIPDLFETTEKAPLTEVNINALPPDAKGAYLLFRNGVPVYAGKTDARHGFQDRLRRHWFTLQYRQNLRIEDMAFKAVRVMVFSNFDVETILIREMRNRSETYLEWNDSGFGSNDPGHRRETQEPADFDEMFPIDIDKPFGKFIPGQWVVRDLLVKAKFELPYLFRYETDVKSRLGNRVIYEKSTVGHVDQRQSNVTIEKVPLTMRDFLRMVVGALPGGWQATVFPGRVILYKENTKYAHSIDRFS